MNNLITTVKANKKSIAIRGLIILTGLAAVTLASGLIQVRPTAKAAEAVENVAKAAKKAAE